MAAGRNVIFFLFAWSLVETPFLAVAEEAGESAIKDVCDASKTGFKDSEQAIVCYAGSFLVKMISELNGGETKSAQHVRVHLLPYLGGERTITALSSDTPDDPKCTVCYKAPEVAAGLTALRASVEGAKVYNDMGVCYSTLTDRILNELPKDKDGVMLVSHHMFHDNPLRQVIGMFRALFVNHAYDTKSCRKPHTGHPFHKIGRKFGGDKGKDKGKGKKEEGAPDATEIAAKEGITEVDEGVKEVGEMKLTEGVSKMFQGVKAMVGAAPSKEAEAATSGDEVAVEDIKIASEIDEVASEVDEVASEVDEASAKDSEVAKEEPTAMEGMLSKVKSAVGLGSDEEATAPMAAERDTTASDNNGESVASGEEAEAAHKGEEKASGIGGVIGNIANAVGMAGAKEPEAVTQTSKEAPKEAGEDKPEGAVEAVNEALGGEQTEDTTVDAKATTEGAETPAAGVSKGAADVKGNEEEAEAGGLKGLVKGFASSVGMSPEKNTKGETAATEDAGGEGATEVAVAPMIAAEDGGKGGTATAEGAAGGAVGANTVIDNSAETVAEMTPDIGAGADVSPAMEAGVDNTVAEVAPAAAVDAIVGAEVATKPDAAREASDDLADVSGASADAGTRADASAAARVDAPKEKGKSGPVHNHAKPAKANA
mmetsp:Transcript_30004/g.41542  ORF Transcript_30004/g.41542 Transcript_30004/m.41542 type:complete len:655 (+) Transcript_30004:104-2068(+)|eukprot:CAMPEP_0196579838 /NCGR_PEP_ID=MMETSP1081-20130531/25077_1 /TAXON_ID=36882 /ORGANISM="Pyramimonas amylifera, Strain CCMP720" /LENGTH=654 /DNA_ID=CAMNT_0041899537 /DNA_START=92 /DNA_END=2056 /DNA_ORIENTATION=-